MNNPWTFDDEPNPAYSDAFANVYTLRWNGLVRGQIPGKAMVRRIAEQLNLANVDGYSWRD